MSERQNVITSGRQGRAPAGPQSLDELPGGGGPARRVRGQAEPDRGLELLCLRRVDALPCRAARLSAATR